MEPNNSNTFPCRRPDLALPVLDQTAVPRSLPPSSAAMSNQQHHLDLSDFDRINRIGIGSWGTVYKVLYRPTATHFSLKVIYGNHDDDDRRQILHQINILNGIDDLNIVKCHDMFDHNGEIQILVEYIDRGSLQGTHLANESSMADLTRQILSGLDYLHRHKIAHRHIKPSNLLINSKKQVKISVSGFMRILEQTTHPCKASVGTIAYLSPGRINTDLNHGKDDGYAGDIWSMGVSILEFYIGVLPFEVEIQDDWASLMCAICMAPPPQAPRTASPEFQDFVACCLQRDPARRWTAAQLLLHPFVTGTAMVDVSTTISLGGVSTQK
ncbi:hypothetical protein L2E82_27819 [Cichorium intybus]|uniref:Uncharacterized protein n=1 Tax=Cichorium intybus TaxID=13427 RepID=A0ACB9CU73_CICIN|nr:hypothetical protein L2E82_27819 [Cichorium intybus]